MTFGSNLIALRKARGIGRRQFAALLGIPYTTLRNYEIDCREPNLALLRAISAALSVSVDELLGIQKPMAEKAAIPSVEALRFARDYQSLDERGRRIVALVLREELNHIAAEPLAAESSPRHIRHFLHMPAAGPANPVLSDEFDLIPLPEEFTHADYALTIDGDSMEPYFPDGSTVFVEENAVMREGDVGIFLIDGETVFKQYHKTKTGDVFLLSCNRARADADRIVRHNSGSTLVCQGRVICKKHPPLPQL